MRLSALPLPYTGPEDVRSILLQCKLTGKAHEACCSLSSLVYVKVKRTILRVYELVAEAYRQRFQSPKKTPNHTYVD